MSADEETPDPVETPGVIGLHQRPAQVPAGVWEAQVNPDGTLARDPEGRLIRVR